MIWIEYLSYHIISYHTISYHIISYHSYHITSIISSPIISSHVSYHFLSYFSIILSQDTQKMGKPSNIFVPRKEKDPVMSNILSNACAGPWAWMKGMARLEDASHHMNRGSLVWIKGGSPKGFSQSDMTYPLWYAGPIQVSQCL